MKTLLGTALVLSCFSLIVGCASTPADEGVDQGGEAISTPNNAAPPEGAKTAAALFTTTPTSTMSIASQDDEDMEGHVWRYDMSDGGFVLTDVSPTHQDLTSYAYALDKASDGKVTVIGVAVKNPPRTSSYMHLQLKTAKKDLAYAAYSVGEVSDPTQGADMKSPNRCDGTVVGSIIDWAADAALVLGGVGGAIALTGVGIEVGFVVMVAGGVVVTIEGAANDMLCD